jgi:hypothetical protein
MVGTTGSGSGVEGIGGPGAGLLGSTVVTGAGAVGEPPPHAINAIALASRRASLNAGGRRTDI